MPTKLFINYNHVAAERARTENDKFVLALNQEKQRTEARQINCSVKITKLI